MSFSASPTMFEYKDAFSIPLKLYAHQPFQQERLLCCKGGYDMSIFKYCTECKKLMQYNGKSLCTDCEAKRQTTYNKNKRDRKADRFYHSKQWKSLSKAVLAKAGYKCALCGGLAVEVHHIQDVRTHPQLRLMPSNLMPLCTACHNSQR